MKLLRAAFIATGVIASVAGYSQTDTTRYPHPGDTTKPGKPDTTMFSYNNYSATAQTQTAHQPNVGRHYVPVLGSYSSATDDKNVTIQGDEQNPGKIWIEGLTADKIFALRKPAMGTYKIPAQKVNDNAIPEGTLLYDHNSREVRICIGRKFVDGNPSEAFAAPTEEATAKKSQKKAEKASVINFTGTKTDVGTAKL